MSGNNQIKIEQFLYISCDACTNELLKYIVTVSVCSYMSDSLFT